jgi:hypothetical protein
MQRKILLLLLLISSLNASAQLSVGADGLTIASGETFSYDGLAFTPSSDYTLTSTVLEKTDAYTIAPAPANPYIKLYYSFSNTAPSFTGTVRFSYAGADLNASNGTSTPVAIAEADLRLNINNATAWTATSDLPVTGVGNEYISSTLAGQSFKFLTLASANAALPLTWLSVNAVWVNGVVAVDWKTATEQNTQDFIVQHSLTARNWSDVGLVAASGYSVSEKSYRYIHRQPGTGLNYYRILQRDLDGKSSISKTVRVNVQLAEGKIFPNPTIGKQATIQLPQSEWVRIFDASGGKVWEKMLGVGSHVVTFEQLPAGHYLVTIGVSGRQFIFIQ